MNMGTFIDLTGHKFGVLTVIKQAPSRSTPNGTKRIHWFCRCECGNEREIDAGKLKKSIRNCSCFKGILKDLTGKHFGNLTVLGRASSRINHGQKKTYWLCKCKCGNEKEVLSSNLLRGNSKSCSCLSIIASKKRALSSGIAAQRALFGKYKCAAMKRKLPFELDINSFVSLCKQRCFYCGSDPSQIAKTKCDTGRFIYNGIDRIDNLQGYISKNCVPSCCICNKMKLTMSQADFIRHVNLISGFCAKRRING